MCCVCLSIVVELWLTSACRWERLISMIGWENWLVRGLPYREEFTLTRLWCLPSLPFCCLVLGFSSSWCSGSLQNQLWGVLALGQGITSTRPWLSFRRSKFVPWFMWDTINNFLKINKKAKRKEKYKWESKFDLVFLVKCLCCNNIAVKPWSPWAHI